MPTKQDLMISAAHNHAQIGVHHARLGNDMLALFALGDAPPVNVPPMIPGSGGQNDPPVVIEPPPVIVDPPSFPSESGYGCPANLDLIDWIFDENTGAGCPAGVRSTISPDAMVVTASYDPKLGKSDIKSTPTLLKGFQLKPVSPGASTNRGFMAGVDKGCPMLAVRDARVLGMNKWGSNGGIGGLLVERVSFIGTFPEHDCYQKPEGGGAGLTYRNLYSRNTGSQPLQIAKREWEAHDFGPGGPIIVDGWLVINHGGGERESQAWKVFSAQAGTQDAQHEVQMPHVVSMRDLWLDDSMRPTCMGALYVGDALDWKVDGLVAIGGELLQQAVSIRKGSGRVEISGLWLEYASGEGGRGVSIDDPDRPIKIHPGGGNLLIKDHNGDVLSSVREGWEQNW